MPSLSVFIACKNHGKYLKEAVYSCLNQTLPPNEVILIKDGSRDNSLEVMYSIQAKEKPGTIKVINHKVGQGHIASYNEGIRESGSEVIHLMAADDALIDPGFYEEANDHFESDDNVGFVVGGLQWMDSRGKLLATKAIPPLRGVCKARDILFALSRYGNFICGGGTLVRKSVQMKAGPYLSELPYSADFANWINVLRQNVRGVFLQRATYGYRRHTEQMTTQSSAPLGERETCANLLHEALK